MSSDDQLTPAVVADGVGVSFLIRYHRSEVTLRESFVRLLGLLPGRNRRASSWRQQFCALKNINLIAQAGDIIGIIGRNGSGKSTLLKTLAGIVVPDQGHVEVRGTVGCLLSLGVGFRTNLSGRENVFLNGSILGLSERDIAGRLDDIIEFSELGEFIHAPVRTYSAGMRGRLGFAIAIHIDPDVLLLDEVLTAGDMAFQKKAGSVLERMREKQKTIVVASHNMGFIRRTCSAVLWLERGEMRLFGDPDAVTTAYAEFCANKAVT